MTDRDRNKKLLATGPGSDTVGGRPMSAKPRAKRSGGKGPLVRGEAVVRGILAAALEELARTGYGALRIEGVAARAGVNKTTVYRRWATKENLVRAALL